MRLPSVEVPEQRRDELEVDQAIQFDTSVTIPSGRFNLPAPAGRPGIVGIGTGDVLMAGRSKIVSGADTPSPPAFAEPDRSELDVAALAEAILARRLRPRVSEVRRLAEALLDIERRRDKKKKKKKSGGKKRKLSRIAGQKTAKRNGRQ